MATRRGNTKVRMLEPLRRQDRGDAFPDHVGNEETNCSFSIISSHDGSRDADFKGDVVRRCKGDSSLYLAGEA